jgi:hypothetical protein
MILQNSNSSTMRNGAMYLWVGHMLCLWYKFIVTNVLIIECSHVEGHTNNRGYQYSKMFAAKSG